MQEFFKYIVLILGILDSWKYHFLARKIARYKSSRDISRKFTNIGILYRIVLFFYAYFLLEDWVIAIGCIIAIFTLSETIYYGYLYYPYKEKRKKSFKRPSFLAYLWNSLLPNNLSKHL